MLLACSVFFSSRNTFQNVFVLFLGVVDSEDIPLNLSRELLQESALIRYTSSNAAVLGISLV